ncbi:hypothetical protein [Micromonospora avicenniae]|uniref:hypothetical protein n=1 Tax=Micromonospora avicenniae TaxID=1198245 RepID=UPI0034461D33
MTEPRRDGTDQLDLATIMRDDELLDTLGRGGTGPVDDPAAAALAAWRTDLDDGCSPRRRGGTPAPPPVGAVAAGRGTSRLAAAVIIVLTLATGLAVGSRDAGPDSSLWPLVRVFHPERAQVRIAEDDLGRARAAAEAGLPDEAWEHLERARRQLAGVDEAAAAGLLADLDAFESALGSMLGDSRASWQAGR